MALNSGQTKLIQRAEQARMGSFQEIGHLLRAFVNDYGVGGDALAAALVKSVSRVIKQGISLPNLRQLAAQQTLLPTAGNGTTLGLGAAAGSVVTGSTSNNTSVTETASFVYVLPGDYIAGAALTVRVRGKVAIARFVSATVAVSVKTIIDGVLSANIGPAAQALGIAYANFDYVITPAGLAAGQELQIDLSVVNNDTGGAAGAAAVTISEVSVLPTIST